MFHQYLTEVLWSTSKLWKLRKSSRPHVASPNDAWKTQPKQRGSATTWITAWMERRFTSIRRLASWMLKRERGRRNTSTTTSTIIKRIGSRSFQISFSNPSTGTTQLLQRDAGMIILKKEWIAPSLVPLYSRSAPTRHQKGTSLQVGEMVIMLDHPESKD